MRRGDLARLAIGAVLAHRLRSVLTGAGIAVGILAVVLLTSIGSGVQRFVISEFTQFGTNLITINPGRVSTFGLSGALVGTIRPLSLEDAGALERVRGIEAVVPMVQGNAAVEHGQRQRRTLVIGSGPALPRVFAFDVAVGRFLPDDDPRAARPYAVLGSKVREELFGSGNPLGQPIRIAGERYRVIGVMESKGQVVGLDLDDTVYLPAARALEMFDREGLMEIDVVYREGLPPEEIVGGLERVLTARHGKIDFTITTQQQMLDTLGSVLSVLTFAVGALGGISLAVGGIGILTIATIAVTERTGEIGLLRALGAEKRQVLALFLMEAIALAGLGGLAGLLAGVAGAKLLGRLVPALPVHTSWGYALGALALAIAIGLLAGILPARRAARLDPLEALRAE